MSQGYLFTPENEEAIYAVSDTCINPPAAIDKLIHLDNNRLLLITGWVNYWVEARKNGDPKGNLEEIAEEYAKRLDAVMKPGYEAYGLLCGYEGGKPVCYHVGRGPNEPKCTVGGRDLHEVLPIGEVGVDAGKKANQEIKDGRPPMEALEDAIKAASALSLKTISGLRTAKISRA
jgi:hypothetical protein